MIFNQKADCVQGRIGQINQNPTPGNNYNELKEPTTLLVY
ncbi:hypothetical protein KS2013_806 [Kangiella sediminilitoris]|uniref:Uncharacterized protein n=1 Tax=Kangiella sediminilitoris TaxID=1144748 RepID=A0A1B3B9Q4_9GAMM|nr:hypothetical protein KS2013_806 [Kangiella sediminilitoris]